MRALAGLIVAGPWQAVLVIALCTVLSFLAPPLTSILAYGGAAALALYSLHRGGLAGVLVLVPALAATALLGELMLRQGLAVGVTSLLLWVPVWLAALVLRETRSLAMAVLVLTGVALLAVLLVFVLFGDPSQWWLERLGTLIDALVAQEPAMDRTALMPFAEQVAPLMTGSLAAGLTFAAVTCLLLGRWWQALLVKPGALRQEFYALRLNRTLSLACVAVVALAALGSGAAGAVATQWSLIVLVPFLFVGLAVIHAALANLKAARGWLIAVYVLAGLLPQALLMVVVTGVLDPWMDLRRRTANRNQLN
ncbi:MAG: hypothetical protein J5I92_16930 [Thiogranum sp.]|nr:hypothetical protein [Thiogranum sp.]